MSSDLIRTKTQILPPETPGGRVPATPPAFRFDPARALSMHRRLAIAAAVTTFFLVLTFGLTRKVSYRSEAIFYVPPVTQELLPQGSTSQGFDSGRYDSTFQQIIQTIQRPDTLMAAVRSLPPGVWRYPGEPVASAAARLASSLNVQRVGTSYQLSVTLSGPRATEVAQTLDAVSKQFLRTVRQDESGITDEQVELLKGEQTRVQASITQLQAEQSKLAAVIGVARLTADQPNPFDTSVEALRKQIEDIRRARDLAVAQVSANGGGYGGESGGNTTTSGLIYGLNTRKATLQSQMSGMTPANPIYQQDQAELQSLDRELAAATRRYRDETNQLSTEQRETTVRRVDGLEAQLRRELARQTELAVTAGPKLQRYAQLTGEITRLQTRAGVLDETIRTRTLEANGPNHVHLAVAPSVPSVSVPGKRNFILLAALPLALIAGMLAAVIAHNRDRRVFLAADLEHVLGFRPMAVLPVPSEVSEPVASGYMLRLAAGIESAFRNNGARTFLFTAPNMGTDVEGLVFKLQMKLKELGYSVLWIGAETLLRAEKDFEEAYGRGPSMGLEEYGKGGTAGVATARLAWLTQDYDMVLIDAPPLSVSAETEYAIRRTDATILVNESGVTTRDDLQAAGDLLEHIGLGSVGAVIKDLHLRDADASFRIMVQDAERVSAKPVHRQPRDNSGEWQVLNPGSPQELHIPGDPVPGIYVRRTRESILRERQASSRLDTQAAGGVYAAAAEDPGEPLFHTDHLHEETLSS